MITLLEKAFDVLFPTACIVCNTEGPDICAPCLRSFEMHKPHNYPWIMSLWNYHDSSVEKIMRSIKNSPNARIADIIARQWITQLKTNASNHPEFSGINNVLVIPIPVGRTRLRERGYNQALLLARPIAKLLCRTLRTDLLIKIKQTQKQGTTKSRAERLLNLKNSFAVNRAAADAVRGRDIVIIDDITTTGSTLVEARETLLRAGARHVVAITVAN